MRIELNPITIRDLIDGYSDDGDDGVYGYHGRLTVRPAYQRAYIYNDRQAAEVIRTVLKDFPLNTMYWMKSGVDADGHDRFELLDGQQRTLSICRFIQSMRADGSWSSAAMFVDDRAWMNLTADERERFLDYELQVYVCEGSDSEKLDWFRTINIAGETLTDQELLNAVYTGEWLTAQKRRFSRANGPAVNMAGMQGRPMVSGKPIRQELLRKAFEWYADKVTLETGVKTGVEQVMARYSGLKPGAPDWDAVWDYWTAVFTWAKSNFIAYRREMAKVPWGLLYNRHRTARFDPADLEARIATLMADDDVTAKTGVYSYVLGGDERVLSIRKFRDADKRAAFERQNRICPACGKAFADVEEGEADHVIAWSKGGRTVPDNCRWLCKACNRAKGDD